MKRILIVDDMEIIREPMAAVLRDNGYEVDVAENGRIALDRVQRSVPDLILLDVSMPVLDGLGFLEALRRNPAIEPPALILLTSVAEAASVRRAARLGVRHYLLKSHVSMVELLERVHSVLDRPDPVDADTPGDSGVETKQQDRPNEPELGDSPNDSLGSLKALRALMTRSQLIARLNAAADLNGLSPTVAQVLKLTQNADVSIEKIADVIRQDYAIAIKVLRLANSSAYSRGQPVDNVDRAITRIGLAQIRDVVLNLAVMEKFATTAICEHVTAGQFWEHSLACGVIAAYIAEARNAPSEARARAFTMGLVHDLGRAMFANALGPMYDHVLRTAEELALPLEQVEQRLLVLNHADVMDRLLHTWGFPKDLIDPIVYHHLSLGNIRQIAPRRVDDVATLALADRLAHALALGTSGNNALYPIENLTAELGLDADVLKRIEEDARRDTADLKLALLSNSDETPWADQREVCRAAFPSDLRPLIVSASPQVDAIRIFFDHIRMPSEGAPNVAIVQLSAESQCDHVLRDLQVAEDEASVRHLPTLVLSPTGEFALPEAARGQRVCRHVKAPIVLSRLAMALHDLRCPDAARSAA